MLGLTEKLVKPGLYSIGRGVKMTFRGSGPIDTAAIYECLDDDEAFAALPAMLAESVGARSTSLAWQPALGGVTILGNNGYFGEGHYADYAQNYSDADLWINAAVQGDRQGVVWNLDTLVSDKEYRDSRFYNDWIRGMGDDTFHCLGLTVVSDHGTGVLGLHRGLGAERFDGGETAVLDHMLPDLKRLFVVRGQLSNYRSEARRASDLLDRVDQSLMLLDREGRLVQANRAGEALIARHGALRIRGGRVEVLGPASAAFSAALARATCPRAPRAGILAVHSANGRRERLIMSPYRDRAARRLALVLGPPAPLDPELRSTLRRMFGLTTSEADVAIRVSEGATLSEIADSRRTTSETVRSQMKAIMSKLDCRRQSEVALVVALIARSQIALGAEDLLQLKDL